MDKENIPDFTGKLVVFYTRNAPKGIQDGILLEFITFAKYGDRLFLNGRIPSIDSKGEDWISNLQAGIAWEDVTHFMIFDSRDDYVDRMGIAKTSFFRKFTG